MSSKEIVQQGLQVRKDVRAAEARAERYRETIDTIRDTMFREQMSHKVARNNWLEEKATLNGIINRQHDTIRQLRESKAAAKAKAEEAYRTRTIYNAVKCAGLFVLMICAKDLGWVVPWLADSLAACALVGAFFAFIKLACKF